MRVERARTSLNAKGFQERKGRDHFCFFFWHGGQKTAIHTKFSHGREISLYQLQKMGKQLKLSDSQQLDRLLSCDMKADEYLAHLINTGVISPAPKIQPKQPDSPDQDGGNLSSTPPDTRPKQ